MGNSTDSTDRRQSPDNPIGALMERATDALAHTRYFEAAELCADALRKARRAGGFGAMARVVLPHLEARRQIVQLAETHSLQGCAAMIRSHDEIADPVMAGCYLLAPPMIGLDARQLRELGERSRVPVVAIAREPLTRAGLVPVVAVGPVVVRVRIEPPVVEQDGSAAMAWFAAALDALGERAIADAERAAEGEPAAFLVDDLMERLVALPEHEGLHRALHAACQRAAGEPPPDRRRRRALVDDPFGF